MKTSLIDRNKENKEYKLSQLFASSKRLQMLTNGERLNDAEKIEIAIVLKSIRKTIYAIQSEK